MSERPKWNGGFAAARRIADEILEDYLGSSRNDGLSERIAEALVIAFDDGVLALQSANEDPEAKRVILTKLLREHGIGVATLEETKARTTAIARGEIKPAPDEPKLWFSSIEVFFGWIKNRENPFSEKDCG